MYCTGHLISHMAKSINDINDRDRTKHSLLVQRFMTSLGDSNMIRLSGRINSTDTIKFRPTTSFRETVGNRICSHFVA